MNPEKLSGLKSDWTKRRESIGRSRHQGRSWWVDLVGEQLRLRRIETVVNKIERESPALHGLARLHRDESNLSEFRPQGHGSDWLLFFGAVTQNVPQQIPESLVAGTSKSLENRGRAQPHNFRPPDQSQLL